MRKAVRLALDREGINQAITLGHSLLTGSIVPKDYEFYWQPPKIPHDPAAARRLLAEAGFRGGFDAGEYYCDSSYANLGEAALNGLAEVGIRLKLRPIERAAFTKGYSEKKIATSSRAAAVRSATPPRGWRTSSSRAAPMSMAAIPTSTTCSPSRRRRPTAPSARRSCSACSSWCMRRTVYAPLWQLAFLNGQGRRVGESALGLISGHPYSAPYEDVRLKNGA